MAPQGYHPLVCSAGIYTFNAQGFGPAIVQNFKPVEPPDNDVIAGSFAQPTGSVCTALGNPPNCNVEEQAAPVGYGSIGKRALTLMFNDSRVTFFVVNAGGHFPISAVQNPAWDFQWVTEDYPLDKPLGFDARLIYTDFISPQTILEQYQQWIEGQERP